MVDGVEAWKADDVKAIAAYLKAPTPATTLALVAGELKKDAPLAKAVAPTGELLLWDVAKKRPPGLGRRAVQAPRRRRPTPEACRALIVLVGDDLYELATEIDKLTTWAAGERVTAADRRAARRGARRGEQLRAHRRVGRPRRGRRAAASPSSCSSERPIRARARSRASPPSSRATSARLRTCQALEAEGLSAKDAAARLKLHPFYVQKLYAQARNFNVDELRDATVRLAELDHALKGGSRLAGELELERALIDITAAAARPRRLGA